jgi:hypothetical protein
MPRQVLKSVQSNQLLLASLSFPRKIAYAHLRLEKMQKYKEKSSEKQTGEQRNTKRRVHKYKEKKKEIQREEQRNTKRRAEKYKQESREIQREEKYLVHRGKKYLQKRREE